MKEIMKISHVNENGFLVTKEQVRMLQELLKPFPAVKTFGDLFMPGSWENFVISYNILFPRTTTWDDKKIDNIKEDQNIRVKSICSYLKKNINVNKVILMDGPGRIVSTLKYQLGKLEKEVKIKVVDIDPIAVEWHNLFFPKEVTNELGNIFDVVSGLSSSENNTFIYLNFCGIAETLNTLSHDQITEFMTKLKQIKHVMLSFSVRTCESAKRAKRAKRVDKTCFRFFRDIIEKDWELVCKRGTFVTYIPLSSVHTRQTEQVDQVKKPKLIIIPKKTKYNVNNVDM